MDRNPKRRKVEAEHQVPHSSSGGGSAVKVAPNLTADDDVGEVDGKERIAQEWHRGRPLMKDSYIAVYGATDNQYRRWITHTLRPSEKDKVKAEAAVNHSQVRSSRDSGVELYLIVTSFCISGKLSEGHAALPQEGLRRPQQRLLPQEVLLRFPGRHQVPW